MVLAGKYAVLRVWDCFSTKKAKRSFYIVLEINNLLVQVHQRMLKVNLLTIQTYVVFIPKSLKAAHQVNENVLEALLCLSILIKSAI